MIGRPPILPLFTKINRNFFWQPLARDARVQTRPWRRPTGTDYFRCRLPGQDRIEFRLADTEDARLKRCPTGFDMNVLWLVIGQSQMLGTPTVEFKSWAAMLSALGMSVTFRNGQRLQEALDLWSAISIKYQRWYDPRSQSHQEKLLPAPFKLESGKAVGITVRRAWSNLTDGGYYAEVPIGLPNEAAPHNLIAYLFHPIGKAGEDGHQISCERRRLCGLIGLNHSSRNQVLPGVCDTASRWFEAQGGSLDWSIDDGDVLFTVVHPNARRKRRVPAPIDKKKADKAKPKKARGESPGYRRDEDPFVPREVPTRRMEWVLYEYGGKKLVPVDDDGNPIDDDDE